MTVKIRNEFKPPVVSSGEGLGLCVLKKHNFKGHGKVRREHTIPLLQFNSIDNMIIIMNLELFFTLRLRFDRASKIGNREDLCICCHYLRGDLNREQFDTGLYLFKVKYGIVFQCRLRLTLFPYFMSRLLY